MSNHNFQPMLASPMDTEKGQSIDSLPYPLLASAKLDGIRCLIIDGAPKTRKLLEVPNAHVRSRLTDPRLAGLDGELMVGESFQAVTSGIMTRGGTPDFRFYVFDDFTNPNIAYQRRVRKYNERIALLKTDFPELRAVPVQVVEDADQLRAFAAKCEAEGYEGAMVRVAGGGYKFGRSTFKECLLVKVKPFEDDEATIIGFEEQMQNNNIATKDELGRTKRSSHKANKSAKGTLGALILNHPTFGEFRCGTGFDDALRQKIWDNQSDYLGKLATFQYQKAGTKDKPRIPSFKGLRHEADMP